MNAYIMTLVVHVAAAMLLVGISLLAAPAIRAAVRRTGDRRDMRTYLAIARPLETLTPLAAMLVLATGIYLASVTRFWGLPWVQVAVACWIVNSAAATALVKPAIARVAAELTADPLGGVGDELDALRWSRRWSYGGDVLMANDGVVLFLMVAKPGLAGSLLAVVAANLLVLSASAVVRQRARGAAAAGTHPQAAWRASPPAARGAVHVGGHAGSNRRLQAVSPGEDVS